MYDLRDRVALVTGAGAERGLGRAIARRLATEGADVAVNDLAARDSRTSGWAGLADVVREIEALGRSALGAAADVSDSQQVDRMVGGVLERFGHIDILVNCAAAPAGRDRVPVVDLDEEAWDLVQRVNVRGTFLVCRAVARAMIARGQGGKIINLSSTSGKLGAARFAAYCTSKFAVRGFTQSLALELAPHGINVIAVCPGAIESERIDAAADATTPEGADRAAFRQEMRRTLVSRTPWGRMGQPDDVAQAVAFLASAEADFLTGTALTVAGGYLID
jgi:NAD(P)-dependent dehydrogenase (short-subunit alcohol dehydrogenase family)